MSLFSVALDFARHRGVSSAWPELFLVDAHRWMPWFARWIQNISLASAQIELRWAVFRKYIKNFREPACCVAPSTRTVSLQSFGELPIKGHRSRAGILLATAELDNAYRGGLSREQETAYGSRQEFFQSIDGRIGG